MEDKNKNQNWTTSDFYSAVIVRASGIPLIELERQDHKFVTFIFQASPKTCEEILQHHWDRSLKIESRLLIETIKEIKTRLYGEMGGGDRR